MLFRRIRVSGCCSIYEYKPSQMKSTNDDGVYDFLVELFSIIHSVSALNLVEFQDLFSSSFVLDKFGIHQSIDVDHQQQHQHRQRQKTDRPMNRLPPTATRSLMGVINKDTHKHQFPSFHQRSAVNIGSVVVLLAKRFRSESNRGIWSRDDEDG